MPTLTSGFPNNVIEVIKPLIATYPWMDLNGNVLAPTMTERPLRPGDPHGSVGLFVVDWAPENEYEIGSTEPTFAKYMYGIQALNKNTAEAEAKQQQGFYAKSLRLMLYQDHNLRVALGGLHEVALGVTETVQQWGVRHQRFASNQIQGSFISLSTTEFWVETSIQ